MHLFCISGDTALVGAILSGVTVVPPQTFDIIAQLAFLLNKQATKSGIDNITKVSTTQT